MKATTPWITYRTRFLVKAKQLTTSLTFADVLGRQHAGRKGDYLVESSDGVISIAPRQIFEDIYVPMTLLGHPGTGDIMIGESTLGESRFGESRFGESMPGESTPARQNFAALQIETVKLGKQPSPRRKLPQPCRDRRGSAPRL